MGWAAWNSPRPFSDDAFLRSRGAIGADIVRAQVLRQASKFASKLSLGFLKEDGELWGGANRNSRSSRKRNGWRDRFALAKDCLS